MRSDPDYKNCRISTVKESLRFCIRLRDMYISSKHVCDLNDTSKKYATVYRENENKKKREIIVQRTNKHIERKKAN